MRKTIVSVVAIALSFTAGGVLGLWADIKPFPLKDTFELLSHMATLLMAIVAIFTLRAWKSEFTNSKRYDALKGLNDALLGLDAFRRFASSFRDLHFMRYKRREDDSATLALDSYNERIQEELIISFDRYKLVWSEASIYLNKLPEDLILSSSSVYDELVAPLQDWLDRVDAYSGRPLTQKQWASLSENIVTQTEETEKRAKQIIEEGSDFLRKQITRTIS